MGVRTDDVDKEETKKGTKLPQEDEMIAENEPTKENADRNDEKFDKFSRYPQNKALVRPCQPPGTTPSDTRDGRPIVTSGHHNRTDDSITRIKRYRKQRDQTPELEY